MWQPYIDSILAHVPGAAQKIVFDRFHITSYLTKAVDLTRRAMMRDASIDRESLKGSKYRWLRNVARMDRAQRAELRDLRSDYKRLGRAWAIKEHFAHLWDYRRESIARKFFAGWHHWATHSRIPAVIEVARTIKRHFENIRTSSRT
jgi:transposase